MNVVFLLFELSFLCLGGRSVGYVMSDMVLLRTVKWGNPTHHRRGLFSCCFRAKNIRLYSELFSDFI